MVTEARRLGAAVCHVGRGPWGALLCPPPLCQLPQGGSYSGSEVSCFAQAQTAANRNGGVCHTVYCLGLGGGGLPQASLPPVAPPAVTLGSEGGRGPDAAQGLGGSHLAVGKSAAALGTALGALGFEPKIQQEGQKEPALRVGHSGCTGEHSGKASENEAEKGLEDRQQANRQRGAGGTVLAADALMAQGLASLHPLALPGDVQLLPASDAGRP